MPDVTISYKDSQIASMDASGTKTLLTEGKYCEDDIVVQYTRYSPEVYAGEHHQPTPSSYTVTVSLTNPINSSYFNYCHIYEATSNSPYSSLTKIGEISSATGSVSVSVNTNLYGIAIECIGNRGYQGGYPNVSCTGGASYTSGDICDQFVIQVTGNGTVTIDSIDWYDD